MSVLSANLNFGLLRTFIRVVETGNISAAARSLFLAQSAISMQLSSLSRAAGVALLERVNGRWQTTPAGEVFYARAREIVTLAEQLDRDLADAVHHVTGHVTLASTRTVTDTVLAELVVAFNAAHPDVRLQIVAGNRRDAELRLSAGEVDAALVALPIVMKGVEIEPFDEDDLVLVVPKAHRIAARESVPFAEIAEEPFVSFERGSGVRALLEARLGERAANVDIRIEVTSNDAMIRCIEAGLGVAFLPQRAAEYWTARETVALVRVADLDLRRQIALVTLEGKQRSTALTTFARWLVERADSEHRAS